MTTLRVVLDQIVAPEPGGTGRYAEELTRHLIETAPAGCDVAGIVPASSAEDYARINDAPARAQRPAQDPAAPAPRSAWPGSSASARCAARTWCTPPTCSRRWAGTTGSTTSATRPS